MELIKLVVLTCFMIFVPTNVKMAEINTPKSSYFSYKYTKNQVWN